MRRRSLFDFVFNRNLLVWSFTGGIIQMYFFYEENKSPSLMMKKGKQREYCMSKKSCPICIVYSLCANGEDFWNIQYVLVCRKIYVFGGFKKPVCGYKPQVNKLLYVQEVVTLQKKYSYIFASEK